MRRLALLLTTGLVVSSVASVLIYWQVENVVAQSAHQFVLDSSQQEDAAGSAQLYDRIFCSQIRHQVCEVEITDVDGQRLVAVPTVSVFGRPWYSQSIHFALPRFSPPLLVVLSFTPSSTYLAIWFTLAIALTAIMALIAWLIILQGSKRALARDYELRVRLHEAESRVARLASQVAHDIRSPLAALNMVVAQSNNMPEELRLLVRSAVDRIRDIANHLLKEQQMRNTTDKALLLSSLVESLVSEKRLQFVSRPELQIETHLPPSSYGIFAQVDRVELQRVLSNLINNAAECQNGKGRIEITLSSMGEAIEIKILDEGPGVPKQVLDRLGERGNTFGKVNGSGLGLYHAKATIEGWGGSLRLISTKGSGTTVVLLLKKAVPPEWFVPRICLSGGMRVVVVDDDPAIHATWDRVLTNSLAGRSCDLDTIYIQTIHFNRVDDAVSYFKSTAPNNFLVLVDYEFRDQAMNGLEFIESTNISNSAILVTSNFEDAHILDQCAKKNIKLIPKGLMSCVPIEIGW